MFWIYHADEGEYYTAEAGKNVTTLQGNAPVSRNNSGIPDFCFVNPVNRNLPFTGNSWCPVPPVRNTDLEPCTLSFGTGFPDSHATDTENFTDKE